jgi:lipid-binding SYLF domain-containing protein
MSHASAVPWSAATPPHGEARIARDRGAASSQRRARDLMNTRTPIAGIVLWGVIAGWGLGAPSDEDKLVAAAERTLSHFENDQDVGWFRDHIREAKALMIAPKVVKAGFVIGGSGGRAVLLHRDPETGEWSDPAFYTLATASVGFQVGVEVSELATLVMTEKGLNAMLGSSFKIGGDVSVAAGPIGAGAKSNVVVDLVTFARSKGVYGGLDLEGTIVKVDRGANAAFYGRDVEPPDILIRPKGKSARAASLRAMVANVAAHRPLEPVE